jgi:hypothetical protein
VSLELTGLHSIILPQYSHTDHCLDTRLTKRWCYETQKPQVSGDAASFQEIIIKAAKHMRERRSR